MRGVVICGDQFRALHVVRLVEALEGCVEAVVPAVAPVLPALEPDAVVFDVPSTARDVDRAIVALRRQYPAARIIVLSADDDGEALGALYLSGADVAIPKFALGLDTSAALRRALFGIAGRRAPSLTRRVDAAFLEPVARP